jgi:hypothetical protein
MAKRPEDLRAEAESAERDETEDEDEEALDGTEPATPPIDQDIAGSVNAAVPETD